MFNRNKVKKLESLLSNSLIENVMLTVNKNFYKSRLESITTALDSVRKKNAELEQQLEELRLTERSVNKNSALKSENETLNSRIVFLEQELAKNNKAKVVAYSQDKFKVGQTVKIVGFPVMILDKDGKGQVDNINSIRSEIGKSYKLFGVDKQDRTCKLENNIWYPMECLEILPKHK